MFTDLNKHAVKSSNSIATLYDSRDNLAVATKTVISQIPFLNQFTDKEKDNLGKNSSKLFTLNNIYKANKRIIKGSEVTESDRQFLLNFWNSVVSNIIEWQELMSKEIAKSDLRQNYILCLNITIAAFGKVGAYFYSNPQINMSKTLEKLRKVNWSRSNMKDWEGRAIDSKGKVVSNELAIDLVSNRIKQLLGIRLSEEEVQKEDSFK